MSGLSDHTECTAEGARALLDTRHGASRVCPAPGCGRQLRRRQRRACSSRCRALLSRMKQLAAREEREKRILGLVLTAHAAVITAQEALAEVRRLLPGGQNEPLPSGMHTL